MYRVWRLVFILMGGGILLITGLRMLQPTTTSEQYRILFAAVDGRDCCDLYMISERNRTANRVQVALSSQPLQSYSLSPSLTWRYSVVEAKRGQYTLYFIPSDGAEPQAAPPESAYGFYYHWDTDDDMLYYLRSIRAEPAGFFRISPAEDEPVRLSRDQFTDIRAIHEQPLPLTAFFPWVLLFLAGNMLFLGGALRAFQIG